MRAILTAAGAVVKDPFARISGASLIVGTVEFDPRDAIRFADVAEWGGWLAAHHDSAAEVWMLLRKQHVADRGLLYSDAVVEALRWGWIDSQGRRVDDDDTAQRWTPRRPGSVWSATNLEAVERLIAEGRMMPAGLAVYEARKPGRERSDAAAQPADLPPEQFAELIANPAAAAFWQEATPGYRKAAAHWVTSAKQLATRQRRLTQLIEDCAAGERIKPEQYGDEPAWLARARAAARDLR